MQEWISRLRAVLTPQIIAWILAAFLLLNIGMNAEQRKAETSDFETRIGRVLSGISGAGDVHVVLRKKAETGAKDRNEEYVTGAIAVAQGADDPLVCLRIQEALCALFGLPSSCVSVISGGK